MLHGECVALGMLAVLELAVKQGTITQYQLEQIRELLHYFDLPLFVSDVSKEKIYQQMFLDKKVNQNKIRFVLPKRIGEVYTTSELSEHDIIKAIEFEKCPYQCEVSVTFTDDNGIRELNRDFRNLDVPTDVLSFPMADYSPPADFSILGEDEAAAMYFNPESGELLLGDIIISLERAKEQAKEYGHSLKR